MRHADSKGNKQCDNTEPGEGFYTSPGWKGPNCYRFQGQAGLMIPESVIYGKHCGTHAAGYLKENNKHPSKEEGTVERQVCFNEKELGFDLLEGLDDCVITMNISILNCGEYYVYKLDNVPCDTVPAKYCGTNECPYGTFGPPPCTGIV